MMMFVCSLSVLSFSRIASPRSGYPPRGMFVSVARARRGDRGDSATVATGDRGRQTVTPAFVSFRQKGGGRQDYQASGKRGELACRLGSQSVWRSLGSIHMVPSSGIWNQLSFGASPHPGTARLPMAFADSYRFPLSGALPDPSYFIRTVEVSSSYRGRPGKASEKNQARPDLSQ